MSDTIDQSNDLYPTSYGAWAGNPAGMAPNLKLCCDSVWDKTSWKSYQCSRPRGHGPGLAYCKQHDPASKAARQAANPRRYNQKHNQERYQWYGRQFFDALQQIADGHNDARGLAQQVISKFKEGERK